MKKVIHKHFKPLILGLEMVFKKGQISLNKGKHPSPETLKKLSESHKGKHQSEETKRKRSESMKGKNKYKRTEEYRKKLSLAHKGKPTWNRGIPMREESKRKLSEALKGKPSPNKGKTASEETRKKLSLSHLGIKYPNRKYTYSPSAFQKGHKINLGRKFPPEFGRKIVETRRKNDSYKVSEETRKRMSEVQKKRMSNPEVRKRMSEITKKVQSNPEVRKRMSESRKGRVPWSKGKKGIHLSPKSEFKKGHKLPEESVRRRTEAISGEKSYLWKGGISFEPYSSDWTRALKRIIRERDNYTCQLCFAKKGINVHHIDYNKKNCNPENLITLCKNCHTKTNHNREKWIKFFKKIS